MKNIQTIGLVMLMLAVACSSSKLTTSWKADNLVTKKYNKILVLGLINEPDRTLREKMEEHLLGELKALGYNTICSCDEFNPKTFEDMTEKQALDKLANSGVDAVLSIVLLDKEKERYYVPGRIRYSPFTIYRDHFWRYYRTIYERVYTPGYYVENTKYFWESNFYEIESKNLIYSAQSQSFDPVSAQSLAHEYGKIIIKDMVTKNILKQQDQ
jgi:hypothetical protein